MNKKLLKLIALLLFALILFTSNSAFAVEDSTQEIGVNNKVTKLFTALSWICLSEIVFFVIELIVLKKKGDTNYLIITIFNWIMAILGIGALGIPTIAIIIKMYANNNKLKVILDSLLIVLLLIAILLINVFVFSGMAHNI